MEFWDIYDKDKKPTGRTMKKYDWKLERELAKEYRIDEQ